MQFECNPKGCYRAAEDLKIIGYKIEYQVDRLRCLYKELSTSSTESDRKVARTLKVQIQKLEDEKRKLFVMYKSIEKIANLYTKTEDSMTTYVQWLDDSRFIRYIIPAPIMPVVIPKINPNILTILLKNTGGN